MSPDLLIGIVGVLAAVSIGTVQILQGRRRRTSEQPDSAARPLREEALTALTDVLVVVGQLGIHRGMALEDAMDALITQTPTLIKLRARLRITAGISDREVETFSEAARMALAVQDSVAAAVEKHQLDSKQERDLSDLEADRRALQGQLGDFHLCISRFEEAVGEAVAR